MKLDGKSAIVTGGASGLGKAIARRYLSEGIDVLIADLDVEAVQRAIADLSGIGPRLISHITDVSDEASVLSMVDAAIAAFGKIDVLVNNAGVCTLREFLDLPVAEWDLVMGVNLKGPFLCGREVGRQMTKQQGGSIINISSIEQDFGSHNRAHYVASKAGVKTLTKAMALNFAPHNIRVNAIAPGGFNTEILEKSFPDKLVREDFIERFTKRIPLKRLGEPAEITGIAAFLASDESSYMTGSIIDINGGASTPVPSDP